MIMEHNIMTKKNIIAEIKDDDLVIVTAHLDSQSTKVRFDEIKKLVDKLSEQKYRNKNIIIIGDYNDINLNNSTNVSITKYYHFKFTLHGSEFNEKKKIIKKRRHKCCMT